MKGEDSQDGFLVQSLTNELRLGWQPLLAAFLGFVFSPMYAMIYSFGMFVQPLSLEFGWSRSDLALGLTLAGIFAGLLFPLAGGIIDRHGERTLVMLSMLGGALCFAALSQIGPNIWWFWLLYIGIGVMMTGCSTLVFSRVVTSNFDHARGTALGIALFGTGLCAMAAPLYAEWAIDSWGWRGGYLAIACSISVAIVPLAFLLKRGPHQQAASPSPEPASLVGGRDFLKTREFWLIAATFFLITMALGGVASQFVPILAEQGVATPQAATLAAVLGGALAAGRLLGGFAADRFFAPYVTATIMALGICGLALLAMMATPFHLLSAALLGLAFGAEIDLAGYITSRYFPIRRFGTVFGCVMIAITAGGSLSHVFHAVLFDATGSYQLSLWLSAGFMAGSIACLLALPPFHDAVARMRLARAAA